MRIKLITAFCTTFILASALVSQQLKAEGESQKPLFNSIERYRQEVVNNQGGLTGYKIDTTKTLEALVNSLDSDQKVFSTITFSQPLSESQVQRLVSNYDLDVKHTITRTKNSSGRRGTLFVNTERSGNLLNADALKQIGENPNSSFVGIIELVAEVPATKALALNLDDNVYLVDPSADSKLVENPTNDYMPGLFWRLEDEGSVPPLGI